MNYDRSRAARPLSSSAALQTTVAIAILALLVVCRPPQQAACAAAQAQTTQAQREEQDGEKRPSVIANQERAVERIQPPSDEQNRSVSLSVVSAQTQTCVPVLTLADLERLCCKKSLRIQKY